METYIVNSGGSLPVRDTGMCCVLPQGTSVSNFRTHPIYPEDGRSSVYTGPARQQHQHPDCIYSQNTD